MFEESKRASPDETFAHEALCQLLFRQGNSKETRNALANPAGRFGRSLSLNTMRAEKSSDGCREKNRRLAATAREFARSILLRGIEEHAIANGYGGVTGNLEPNLEPGPRRRVTFSKNFEPFWAAKCHIGM
jgi:hypothetical protein